MGSFVTKTLPNPDDPDGTTCDGKWSCGRAIYACLDEGDGTLVENGVCRSAGDEYCVTCQ